MTISRRDFLKKSGLATLGLILSPSLANASTTIIGENHDWNLNLYVDEKFLEDVPLRILEKSLELSKNFYNDIGREYDLPGVNLNYSYRRNVENLVLENPRGANVNLVYASMDAISQMPEDVLAYGLSGCEDFTNNARNFPGVFTRIYRGAGIYHPHINTIIITPESLKHENETKAISLGGFITSHEIGHSLGLEHVEDSNNLMSPRLFYRKVMSFPHAGWFLNRNQVEEIGSFFRNLND